MTKNKMFFLNITLKYFTLNRFFNAVKVLMGYLFSLIFRRPFNWGQPIVLSVEPSSVCQLNCPECFTGLGLTERETKFMDFDLYKSKSINLVSLSVNPNPVKHSGQFN